jgi:adenylate cyclase
VVTRRNLCGSLHTVSLKPSSPGPMYSSSPAGLAWAKKLALPAITMGADEQDIFRITLTVGLLAVSIGVYSLGAIVMSVTSPEIIPFMLFGIGACVGGLILVRWKPMHMLVVTSMIFALVTAIWLGITVTQGGLVRSGVNVIWGLVAPMLSMLLFGQREATLWFVVFLVGTVCVVFAPASVFSDPVQSDMTIVVTTTFNLVFFGALMMLAITWFVQLRTIVERQLQEEQARSEALLLNVLPEGVARRLKDGIRIADAHTAVSVLFADLVGFTPLSATLAPHEVLTMLDHLFREFDAVVTQYGVEKIKTIGDCYMIAAGVPHPLDEHAKVLVEVALELLAIIEARDFGGHRIQMRIGIHSGPLTAGVIGEKRLLYDLWGDTVNTASRMESSGVPGRIQISEESADLVKNCFALEERGPIEIKGKGTLRPWLVVGPL